MKVLLKAGKEKNEDIKQFFIREIFPLLEFGIAFEFSNSEIQVLKKLQGSEVDIYKDPTVEIYVELPFDVISFLKDNCSKGVEFIRCVLLLNPNSREFVDEGVAIHKLENMNLPFSIEYYSCRYTPANN